MEENEVIFIHGTEKYSDYEGYKWSVKCKGGCENKEGERASIVGMNASVSLRFDKCVSLLSFLTDLNKAYLGFSFSHSELSHLQLEHNDDKREEKLQVKDKEKEKEREEESRKTIRNKKEKGRGIATGNWGCGVFNGDKSEKYLQQLLAASENNRQLYYFTFGETYRGLDLKRWIDCLNLIFIQHSVTVGELYSIINQKIEKEAKLEEKKEEKEKSAILHNNQQENESEVETQHTIQELTTDQVHCQTEEKKPNDQQEKNNEPEMEGTKTNEKEKEHATSENKQQQLQQKADLPPPLEKVPNQQTQQKLFDGNFFLVVIKYFSKKSEETLALYKQLQIEQTEMLEKERLEYKNMLTLHQPEKSPDSLFQKFLNFMK
eukprot:CAMPEP_0174259736 /NCGR_PEP_ID=MMETSP0439-20130205/8525_1 /TAXON_ID=0 /ORGANISM="Stereomyxa ramosa, Strain Chinc5" /LENGTH=375 /DNA_ID=CAMNT_0015343749 /DNA_START=859 /DNA_END=1983 /DNA_ORIENTATION=+